MNANPLKKTGIALLLVAALLLAPTLVVFAAAGDVPNPDATGSITVHKFSTGAPSELEGTGLRLSTEEEAELGEPLENVGFTLYRVPPGVAITEQTTRDGVDVTVPRAVSTIVAETTNETNLVGTGQQLTNAAGITEWLGLSPDYYVLVETASPTGHIPAEPALIQLPFGYSEDAEGNPTGRGWTYDIHVYPKNITQGPITKSILNERGAYTVGDAVTYFIQAPIDVELRTGDAEPYTYGSFTITDPLDYRLSYAEGTATLVVEGGDALLTLTSPGQYTETVTPGTGTDPAILTWELTPQGIDDIIENGVGLDNGSIEVELPVTVNENATNSTPAGTPGIANGVSSNQQNAGTAPTDPPDITHTLPDEARPVLDLAGIRISKINNDTRQPLDGATFKIADSKTNANNGIFLTNAAGDEMEVVTSAHPTDETIPAGWGMFTGLTAGTYYLRETQVPAGFVVPNGVWEVVVATGSGGTQISPITIANQVLGGNPIEGVDKPSFLLPATGGAGKVIFMAAGIVVMLVAAGALFAGSRRKKATGHTKQQ